MAGARRRKAVARWPELFHFTRAACWPMLGVYVFAFNPALKTSIALLLIISLYANFGTDISSAQAAIASRHSKENPPEEADS